MPHIPLTRDDDLAPPGLRATPEYALCAAILVRAFEDLRTGDAQAQGDAARWVATGACAWLCTVLDLPLDTVQAQATAILHRQAAVPSTGR